MNKIFKFVLLCVCVLIFAACIYYFKFWSKSRGAVFVPASEERTDIREVIKQFTFSQAEALREWDEKNLSRNSTQYDVFSSNGDEFIKAVSENSASAIFFKERLDYKKDPFISWSWKAEKFPSWRKGEDLKKKNEFDFVAQVYVIFHSRFFLKTKAIQYVWTESIPKGTIVSSPYTDNVKVMVLESGDINQWKTEDRDIVEDFRNLFGQELEKDVVAVAFMTDSDSTDSDAEASYDNFSIGYIKKSGNENGSSEEEPVVEEKGKGNIVS